jgi:hypothetical protein
MYIHGYTMYIHGYTMYIHGYTVTMHIQSDGYTWYIQSDGYTWYIQGYTMYIPWISLRYTYTWYIPGIFHWQAYTGDRHSRWIVPPRLLTVTWRPGALAGQLE